MTNFLLRDKDLDTPVETPAELERIVNQNLVDLTPWHVMDAELAKKRLAGVRARYRRKYVPFARRQDNDDLACLDPTRPGCVVVIHDFADEGCETVHEFKSFWDWFRVAVEDMISFNGK